jgi:hypothetical protein
MPYGLRILPDKLSKLWISRTPSPPAENYLDQAHHRGYDPRLYQENAIRTSSKASNIIAIVIHENLALPSASGLRV